MRLYIYTLLFVSIFIGLSGIATAAPAPRAPTDYTAVAASTFLGDANAYKMAYIAQVRAGVEMEIASNSYYHNNATQADELRSTSNQSALNYVNGDHFNEYLPAVLKDGVAVASAATTAEFGIP